MTHSFPTRRSSDLISTGSDMDAFGASGGAMFQQFMATAQSQATGLLQKAASMFSRFMPVHVTRVVDRSVFTCVQTSLHFLPSSNPRNTNMRAHINIDRKSTRLNSTH